MCWNLESTRNVNGMRFLFLLQRSFFLQIYSTLIHQHVLMPFRDSGSMAKLETETQSVRQSQNFTLTSPIVLHADHEEMQKRVDC